MFCSHDPFTCSAKKRGLSLLMDLQGHSVLFLSSIAHVVICAMISSDGRQDGDFLHLGNFPTLWNDGKPRETHEDPH